MIIGLSGKIGVGKTTLAHLLERRLVGMGYSVLCTSFGYTLKLLVSGAYQIPKEVLFDQKKKEVPISLSALPTHLLAGYILPEWEERGEVTPREIMQWYATEFVRKESPDFWVERTAEDIIQWEVKQKGKHIAIIDDVRFPNELKYVRANGLCFRLLPYPEWEEGKYANHASETALDAEKWDERFVLAAEYGRLEKEVEKVMQVFNGCQIKKRGKQK